MREPFKEKIKIVNVGAKSFYESLVAQHADVVHVEWKPPAGGNLELVKILEKLDHEKMDNANKKALSKVLAAKPVLVDIQMAIDVIPGIKENMILHAGPPVKWEDMCGPMRGAICGALVYEGRANSVEEAEKIAASGKIEFAPCHEHSAVGPMTGVTSPGMPVFVIENRENGNKAYITMNEGRGKVLRFGANSEDVIQRLRWMRDVLTPVLKKAINNAGEMDLKSIMAQAVQMGDEGHNRNRAASMLFLAEITPHILKTEDDVNKIIEVFDFVKKNADIFFLNLSMGAAKASADAARNVDYSSLVVAMTRNGAEFGIQVSGLGNRWFTAPAPKVKGLYFPGYTESDACPDLGDSTITEVVGLGGFAMAAAPTIVQFAGGEVGEAIRTTEMMYEITVGTSRDFTLPILGFRGTPTGIDVTKVVETGVVPRINTGIAHKKAGIGQIGGGLVEAPMKVFEDALKELGKKYLR